MIAFKILRLVSISIFLVNVFRTFNDLHDSTTAGDQRIQSASTSVGGLQRGSLRNLQQLGIPWQDNGGSWPAGFSDLDRAAETQRIFRSVVAERNKTAVAVQNLDAAWAAWLNEYNVTYKSEDDAKYRRSVFDFNVQRAHQLNELAGLEVAFGINRFSILTPEEFLGAYTGDMQDDSGINIKPENPELIDTPAARAIADMKAAADAAANVTGNATGNGTAGNSTTGTGGAGGGTRPGGGGGGGGGLQPPNQPPADGGGGVSQPFSTDSMRSFTTPGGGSTFFNVLGSANDSSSSDGRGLLQQQQQQQMQQQMGPLRRLLSTLLGSSLRNHGQSGVHQHHAPAAAVHHAPFSRPHVLPMDIRPVGASSRKLQQVIPVPVPLQRETFCSRQRSFPYSTIIPFKSVDWLRAGAVTPVRRQANCSNSFAFVAAALAESTMRMQGYNGSAMDISETQIMQCFPGSSCSQGGTVHVVLNYLACNGVAAVDATPGRTYGAYPTQNTGTPADFEGKCAQGKYQPVNTGITGWAWVPNNEFALGQALSRTPAKVSVDASILQSYRAGFIGCNVMSRLTNHALLAVGYNIQMRAAPPPPGSTEQFTFFNGSEYWMLKNSWGDWGSVDGYVYITKGCPKATPLGMMLNRGVIPTWNQTESYKIGRLECANETVTSLQCNKDLLLRLAGYCAGVDEYMPMPQETNCSCSCIPT